MGAVIHISLYTHEQPLWPLSTYYFMMISVGIAPECHGTRGWTLAVCCSVAAYGNELISFTNGKINQITCLAIVYSAVYSGADQGKHQSSTSLAFVWGIHRWPVNSPHNWPVFIWWRHNVIMYFMDASALLDDTHISNSLTHWSLQTEYLQRISRNRYLIRIKRILHLSFWILTVLYLWMCLASVGAGYFLAEWRSSYKHLKGTWTGLSLIEHDSLCCLGVYFWCVATLIIWYSVISYYSIMVMVKYLV